MSWEGAPRGPVSGNSGGEGETGGAGGSAEKGIRPPRPPPRQVRRGRGARSAPRFAALSFNPAKRVAEPSRSPAPCSGRTPPVFAPGTAPAPRWGAGGGTLLLRLGDPVLLRRSGACARGAGRRRRQESEALGAAASGEPQAGLTCVV